MPARWYLCPYDTGPFKGGIGRRCAMNRYVQQVAGTREPWKEIPCLGNHCLVRVAASLAVHALIEADPDFFCIPTDVPEIPAPTQLALRTRLLGLGYRSAEITAAGSVARDVLRLIASIHGQVRVSADGLSHEPVPGVRVSRDPGIVNEFDTAIPD